MLRVHRRCGGEIWIRAIGPCRREAGTLEILVAGGILLVACTRWWFRRGSIRLLRGLIRLLRRAIQVLPFECLAWENFERFCLRLAMERGEVDHSADHAGDDPADGRRSAA